MKRAVVSALLLASASVLASSLVAQGRGPAPAAPPFDPHDISGFWSLGMDGRRVPPARLIPSATKAALGRFVKQDAHNVRWCNLIGTPAVMDSGRPLDIRQGPTAVIIVRISVFCRTLSRSPGLSMNCARKSTAPSTIGTGEASQ